MSVSSIGTNFISSLSPEDRQIYDELFDFMIWRIEEGWLKKIVGKIPDSQIASYKERLQVEVHSLYNLGFVKYVLVVWDMCEYAKEKEIPFNARGSANASLALYCLDIISLDPMIYGPGGTPLIFERFISPNRNEYPD